jgi:hypothetical protein
MQLSMGTFSPTKSTAAAPRGVWFGMPSPHLVKLGAAKALLALADEQDFCSKDRAKFWFGKFKR